MRPEWMNAAIESIDLTPLESFDFPDMRNLAADG
jgi:hypothetical protein